MNKEKSNKIVQSISLGIFLLVAIIGITERISIIIKILPVIGVVCLLISVFFYFLTTRDKNNTESTNKFSEKDKEQTNHKSRREYK
jgi:predicted membrane channel-forming protein YqfA (hemolysin III family)